jgi:hydrogenase maturation protease
MRHDGPSILFYGFGNPGRCDDGLGPAAAEAIAEMGIDGVAVDSDYQLNIENAAEIATYDVVVFADAALNCPAPYTFKRLDPQRDVAFTTHSVSPNAVVAMACDMFGGRTKGYMLGIRGHEFNEYRETLSEDARSDLKAALQFVGPVLRERNFDQFVT